MIDVFPFAGYPVALWGLGPSGLTTARALAHSEAELVSWDDDPRARQRAETYDLSVKDWTCADLREFTTVVLCPEPSHGADARAAQRRIEARARAAGCEVIADTELLSRSQRECGYIGVAGANGAALACAMIGHILRVTGREAEIVEGAPASALDVDPLGQEGAYVLEMTPFRLEHTVSITFDIGVFLGALEGLSQEAAPSLPCELFRRQTHPRAAIVCVDTPLGKAVHDELVEKNDQRIFPVSCSQEISGGVFVKDGVLFDATQGDAPVRITDLASMCGDADVCAIAAAFAACLAAGVQPYQAMAAMNGFPGFDVEAA